LTDTTMMFWDEASSEPSYWSPAPVVRPPPWIMNITGSLHIEEQNRTMPFSS
jgi:hypothetical protein